MPFPILLLGGLALLLLSNAYNLSLLLSNKQLYFKSASPIIGVFCFPRFVLTFRRDD